MKYIHHNTVSSGAESFCLLSPNMLIPIILGGGIAARITRYIIDNYRAFQRCLRAPSEGFVVYIGSMTKVIKAIKSRLDDEGHKGYTEYI